MEKVKLIGEIPVYGESSAAFAISRLTKRLETTSDSFEDFFQSFQLNVKNWSITEVDHTPDCFYMQVEANVELPKHQNMEAMKLFISSHEHELYHSANGFLPFEIIEL